MLMGLHMAILCAADFIYGSDYYIYSEEWWVSKPCRLSGFLSLLSAEACVFFLLMISVDVYIRVKHIETEKRMSIKTARWAALGVWSAAGFIALTGSLSASVDSEFYYLSDFCIGLPLIRRPSNLVVEEGNASSPFGNRTINIEIPHGTKPAWALSIFLFMVLHVICFTIAVVLYREHNVKVAKIRAERKKQKEEERALREEEFRREMEEDGLDDEENGDGNDAVNTTKNDEKLQTQISQEVDRIVEQRKAMGIEDGDDNIKTKRSSSNRKGTNQSFKMSKRKFSLRKKKRSKQKVRRTTNVIKKDLTIMTNATDIKEPEDNYASDDNENSKEIPTISKTILSEQGSSDPRGSDIEADRHSDTESKKQSDNDDDKDKEGSGDDDSDAESEMSDAESEPEPYDYQTCKMYRYMRFVLYFDIFCWSPLIIMGFLSQCGLDIPVIAYAYTAAAILPIIAYMTPIVIMFITCDCVGDPVVPDYIINSEGEIQPVTDLDVYNQTWMMMQI